MRNAYEISIYNLNERNYLAELEVHSILLNFTLNIIYKNVDWVYMAQDRKMCVIYFEHGSNPWVLQLFDISVPDDGILDIRFIKALINLVFASLRDFSRPVFGGVMFTD